MDSEKEFQRKIKLTAGLGFGFGVAASGVLLAMMHYAEGNTNAAHKHTNIGKAIIAGTALSVIAWVLYHKPSTPE